jgi:aspartyl-tRNA(Asn)/glutamyl-tRNA(Gln) amidotransferase subunit C
MVASSVPDVLGERDLDRIAALARLELTPSERQLFARQLAGILDYAQQVREVDTTGVAATAHLLTLHPTLREDEPALSLPREDALAGAPEPAPESGLFKVPKVL